MSVEVVQIGTCTLYTGTVEEVLPTLPDVSVHLIIADPPYHKVKMDYCGEKILWDRQWPTREAYLSWLRGIAKEWRRVLAPNGSLYCFASPQMAAWVEVMLNEVFHVLTRITWRKPPYSTKAEMFTKEAMRSFFPASEIIIFAEQYGADSMALGESGYAAQCEMLHGHVFESLRAYLEGERTRAGIGKAACNAACGFAPIAGAMASRHYFSRSQWQLPTAPHYAALQHLFNTEGRVPAPPFQDFHPVGSPFARFHSPLDEDLRANYEDLRANYEYLRANYEDLRANYEDLRANYEDLRANYEDLRRPFTVTAAVPYTDVWDFATVPYRPGKHPCEKPVSLLIHMIQASSRPGDVILDCFAGSHATAEAARQCGRCSLSIEADAQWVARGMQRLKQLALFGVA